MRVGSLVALIWLKLSSCSSVSRASPTTRTFWVYLSRVLRRPYFWRCIGFGFSLLVFSEDLKVLEHPKLYALGLTHVLDPSQLRPCQVESTALLAIPACARRRLLLGQLVATATRDERSTSAPPEPIVPPSFPAGEVPCVTRCMLPQSCSSPDRPTRERRTIVFLTWVSLRTPRESACLRATKRRWDAHRTLACQL